MSNKAKDFMGIRHWSYDKPVPYCAFCKKEKQHYVDIEFFVLSAGASWPTVMCEDCFQQLVSILNFDLVAPHPNRERDAYDKYYLG